MTWISFTIPRAEMASNEFGLNSALRGYVGHNLLWALTK